MKVLRIVDWDDRFENSRSRGRQNLHWVPIPNKHDGDGYTELISHANGAAHFGAWVLIIQVASKCHPRGTLVRDGGRPYDEEALERVTRCPAQVFAEAIPRLLKIGWLESIEPGGTPEWQPGDTRLSPECHPSVHRTEEKRTEQKGTGNGTEARHASRVQSPESHSGEAFDRFWEKYPRKTGKAMAVQMWLSLGLDAIADQVMAGLERWLRSEEWEKENGKYIPAPAKWLSEKRWLDDPKPADADLPEYWR